MTEIRSYRAVFDLERRIYRIDRLRLNPSGLPVRGAVYFLALVAGTLLAGSLPLLGWFASSLPWYVVDVALPAASAALLTMVRIEGRPFHLAAQALARHRLRARRLAGWRPCRAGFDPTDQACGRWYPEDVVLLPDGSDGRMRRLRYRGPGAVLVAVEHRREGSPTAGRTAWLGRLSRRPQVTLREPPAVGAGGGVVRPAGAWAVEDRGGPTPRPLEGEGRGSVIALAPGARLRVG